MQRSATLIRTQQPARAPFARHRAALADLRQRLTDPLTRPALLWRALWAPFLVWSDSPWPTLPQRAAAVPSDLGLAGEAVVAGIDRIRRRLWISHAAAAVCRGIWLGLAVAAVLMLVDVLGGSTFDPRPAAVGGGLLLAASLILAALSKPSRWMTARMLDRTFGLQERLATALDDLGLGVPAPGERAPVVYLQMADAANAIAALRNDRRLRPAIPVRELVLVVLCALILATFAFLRGLGGGLPELAAANVPPFTPAIERPPEPAQSAAELEAATAPTVQEVLERADRSSQARRDLQALAAAMADHAVTRPAAEQIARGNYEDAGEQIREAAAQSGELSQGARQGLAGDLEGAADRMQPETNGLEEATRDAASGLRQGDEPARTEMDDLADAVENAGEQIVPQGELASQMRSAQQAQAQRGESGSQSSSSSQSGETGDSSSEPGASGDPGSGADAEASSSSESDAQSESSAQPGDEGDNAGGQSGQEGEGGQATAPGDADQPGPGESGAPGDASRPGENPGSMEGEGDSAGSQQGGGAGTGEAGEMTGERGSAAATDLQVGTGEDPAEPDISAGTNGEADPAALDGANAQVALPSGPGEEGVQTASDGGSAMRGSGAGVTAGSGFAVQGEVGETGPDSNRVPAEHRETVERYFSNGGGE